MSSHIEGRVEYASRNHFIFNTILTHIICSHLLPPSCRWKESIPRILEDCLHPHFVIISSSRLAMNPLLPCWKVRVDPLVIGHSSLFLCCSSFGFCLFFPFYRSF